MTEIIVAKTAGFCFGVARAVKLCETMAAEGKRLATLGPVIHNKTVADQLAKQGVREISSPEQALAGETVVVRSHGAPPEIFERIRAHGNELCDATCPYVARIHDIVTGTSAQTVIIIGDRNHPEIQALAGCCGGKELIFSGLDELKTADLSKLQKKSTIIVAQTTYNLLQYQECVDYAMGILPQLESHLTVCSATKERQREASELAQSCDVMIVIGDTESSNTRKMFELCRSECRAYAIETAAELTGDMLNNAERIGVTAGASTPVGIIEEVLTRMSEEIKNTQADMTAAENDPNNEEELDFVQAVEHYLRRASRNQRYVGVVTSVLPNEVVVDIGTKQTGIIPADELTDDSSARIADLVKPGDKLDLIAIKVNDSEGIVTLSKKRLDAVEGFNTVQEAANTGAVLEAFVTEKVNAGIIAFYKGVRIFIHESQATLHKDEDIDKLLKTTVKLKIFEVKGPNSVRGSIRRALLDARDEKRKELWEGIEVGKTYHGTVKSLTTYGAFIDIGGIDGMAHISELSWGRINHPREVLSVGDEVDVYVKALDKETHKISLGYKKEEDNPWNQLRFPPVGTVFTGPVVSIIKSGAFVRILPHCDGFVHVSQISDKRVENPADVLTVGQVVNARLLAVDFERQRVSLSLRSEEAPVEEQAEEPTPEKKPRAKKAAPTETETTEEE